MTDAVHSDDVGGRDDPPEPAGGFAGDYRLPALPKMSAIANINAAIAATILTVVFTIVNQHKLIESIVDFSNLILCFAFGAGVSLLSCVLDYRSRRLYRSAVGAKAYFVDVGNIYDSCAFCVFVASLAIFVFGCFFGGGLIWGAFK
jgi:hypothetical protein